MGVIEERDICTRIWRKLRCNAWLLLHPTFRKQGAILFGIPEIIHYDKVIVGKNLHINSGCYIQAEGTIKIGDNVTLSNGVKLISTSYDIDVWSEVSKMRLKPHCSAPITIGNNVWIAAGAMVLQGVNIPDNTIIAAGAIVTGNITESGYIYGGVPAKKIRRLK